jgi:hypothetical protein
MSDSNYTSIRCVVEVKINFYDIFDNPAELRPSAKPDRMDYFLESEFFVDRGVLVVLG